MMKPSVLVLFASLVLGSVPANAGIVNGEEVISGRLPQVVRLFIDGEPECSATIVGPQALVTAAHCTKGVIYQRNVQFKVNGDTYEVELYPSPYYVHEKWLKRDNAHDVALGKISKIVKGVNPATICSQVKGQMKVSLAGYGEADSQGSDGILRMGENVITVAEDPSREDAKRNIKIGPTPNGANGNFRDSGGSVFSKDENGKTCLAGVISYGSVSAGFTAATRLDHYDSRTILPKFSAANKLEICGVTRECPEMHVPIYTENRTQSPNTHSPSAIIR
jgi:hypothetical protein